MTVRRSMWSAWCCAAADWPLDQPAPHLRVTTQLRAGAHEFAPDNAGNGHLAAAAWAVMSSPVRFLLLAAVASLPAHAAVVVDVEVPAATASTSVLAASSLSLADRAEIFDQAFGAHQVTAAGGQARASVTLGANGDYLPFIAFSAAASGRSFADLSGQLVYHWVVQGAPGSTDLVPVTITSLGHIRAQVTAQAVRADMQAGASANWVGMLVSNTFETWSTDGRQDIRTYGVNSGNRAGPQPIGFDDPDLSAPGGSVTATGEASFAETFTLMVYPNAANRIVMQVSGGVANGLYNSDDPLYSWAIRGYLDPVITIDAAYAGDFSVVQSAIPMVPVPEASTWALMLAGLGLVAGVARRRSITAS